VPRKWLRSPLPGCMPDSRGRFAPLECSDAPSLHGAPRPNHVCDPAGRFPRSGLIVGSILFL
jgi:hypothetical protein